MFYILYALHQQIYVYDFGLATTLFKYNEAGAATIKTVELDVALGGRVLQGHETEKSYHILNHVLHHKKWSCVWLQLRLRNTRYACLFAQENMLSM